MIAPALGPPKNKTPARYPGQGFDKPEKTQSLISCTYGTFFSDLLFVLRS